MPMLRLHISQAWCHKPVIPVVRGLRKKDQKFKASLAISSTLVSKRKVDAVGAHLTLRLIPSPTILAGCYVLTIIVYLRWRQELRDLRSSLTLYGVQGHHGYTKQSQSTVYVQCMCGKQGTVLFPCGDADLWGRKQRGQVGCFTLW